MRRIVPALLLAAFSFPASAQQGGGHPDMQTAVLQSLVAERGAACGLMASWETEVLRAEARGLYEKLEPAERPAFRKEAAERAAATACDDVILQGYVKAHRELWATEALPRFLAAYRGLALMEEPPATFRAAADRLDYGEAVRAIDAHLAALEVAGVAAPGRGSWAEFADRTGAGVAGRARALGGEGEIGRSSPDATAAFIVEAAVITEAWLASRE